ncbi:CPBP family intramembrane metalloprotease (plasmid) [Limosilactobacillus reuteri]|uniref:CPBP family intramembrane metalloprotease n=1 Tax=Limosilactobacillus reuteri TaxID=1598 RepID=A0A517D8C4_LIMRT|nr:CPBP family glutamic-type intramembrane protease [Limosilactobacillus reuteri]QDR73595.1 CPBP family intramembrane metalloprotease [Limosilactobacillus reuteri]
MFVVIMLIPLLLILGINHWIMDIYRHSHWPLFLTAWEAGIAEEFAFRLGVFSMIYKLLRHAKLRLILSIGLTSLSFGCLHLLNATQQPL